MAFTPYARAFAAVPPAAGPRMGLRPIPVRDWLTRCADHEGYMTAKRRRMDARPETVFQALPESLDAQAETLRLVQARIGGNADRSRVPLDAAARLVEEDLCLMQARADRYWLTAGSVASPSYWRLADKLGKELLDIHAPVRHLRERIGARMRHFFRTLAPGRVYLRGNWFLHASGEPFRGPEHVADAPVPGTQDVQGVFLRCERQTLRRLPQTGAVLFTIRVFLNPLADLAAHPVLAADLRDALSRPDVLQYRTHAIPTRRDAVLAWLREVAAPP